MSQMSSKDKSDAKTKYYYLAAVGGVQLHGVVTEEENMMIVLEYVLKGNLRKFSLNLK